METFYETVNRICREKGTTATTVLKAIGASTGNVSKWKNGSIPNIDLALRFARYLGITLDYLVTGEDVYSAPLPVPESGLSSDDAEWLSIIRGIPAEKQEMCKDFLRTHAYVPEKYADKKKA